MTTKASTSIRKEMINTLVNPPQAGFVTRFWPREMKLAAELFEMYPSEEFWKALKIDGKVNSLAAFKMKKLADEIAARFRRFSSKEDVVTKEKVEIFQQKFGDSPCIVPQKRFLSDFLR